MFALLGEDVKYCAEGLVHAVTILAKTNAIMDMYQDYTRPLNKIRNDELLDARDCFLLNLSADSVMVGLEQDADAPLFLIQDVRTIQQLCKSVI